MGMILAQIPAIIHQACIFVKKSIFDK